MPFGSNIRCFTVACWVAAAVLQSGCGREPTHPAVTDIRVAVTAAPEVGSPSAPIAIHVLVTNVGNTRVWHCSGCGCGNGIGITVLGPDGTAVALTDPAAPMPLCPDGFVPLEPTQTLESGATFTGTLYQQGSPTPPSPTYTAPSGTYTLIAWISYRPSATGKLTGVERRTTFVWEP